MRFRGSVEIARQRSKAFASRAYRGRPYCGAGPEGWLAGVGDLCSTAPDEPVRSAKTAIRASRTTTAMMTMTM